MIALWNYIPRELFAQMMRVINRVESVRGRFSECERLNPNEGVYIKKLQDFNTKQWDHELILPNAACEKKKLENSLVVIYSSAIKIT